MGQPMGLGQIGNSNLVFKRKFRWTFVVENVCGDSVPEHFVKLAARPNISIEETEINFLNAKTWIPGKGTWETITVTYYDVATGDNAALWRWLANVYDFTDPTNLPQASARGGAGNNGFSGTGQLRLFDGCGTLLETWTMKGMWPTAINFGDLDYSNSEECTVELTLRYDEVQYRNNCPGFDVSGCCTGCK